MNLGGQYEEKQLHLFLQECRNVSGVLTVFFNNKEIKAANSLCGSVPLEIQESSQFVL